MNQASSISPELVRAYYETEYHVLLRPPVTLRIGQINEDLKALYRESSCNSCLFITAWNPYSEHTEAAMNALLQSQLFEEISASGYRAVPGLGKHPSGDWEGEDSLLVLGVSQEEAMEIGTRWKQNAVIWTDAQACPQLILLR